MLFFILKKLIIFGCYSIASSSGGFQKNQWVVFSLEKKVGKGGEGEESYCGKLDKNPKNCNIVVIFLLYLGGAIGHWGNVSL